MQTKYYSREELNILIESGIVPELRKGDKTTLGCLCQFAGIFNDHEWLIDHGGEMLRIVAAGSEKSGKHSVFSKLETGTQVQNFWETGLTVTAE